MIDPARAADPQSDQGAVSDQLMKTSATAKAFVDAWTPILAQSSFYLDKSLRTYQQIFSGYAVGGAGYERTQRMWNMLTQKQYFNITSSVGSGVIDLPYCMEVLRSRGVEAVKSKDEGKQMWCQKPLDLSGKFQGVDAICKNIGASGESIGLT